ncbi:MAG: Organic solvent tolerance protein OstA [Cyclobacteriaceae bacterium]|nr:Organic solvent tolerance protein OstA [Cyclobacteriaceae bacterium]
MAIIFPAYSQVKLSIKKADYAKGKVVNGSLLNILTGNVVMLHDDATIYCDSAVFYDESNRVEAFGRVRIVDTNTTISSNRASYTGDSKIAALRGNVVFRQTDGITLYTEKLDYNRGNGLAKYFDGGKLVDGVNVLNSVRGYYNEHSRIASFGKDVRGKNPDWSLTSDTLQYNTNTKVMNFTGPTTLVDNNQKSAKYETGFYNTITKRSSLRSGEFETPNYFLQGNQIELNDQTQYYTATEDVFMISKDDNVIISGEKAIYDKAHGRIKVFQNALLKRVLSEGDTLYLRADTLMSVEQEDAEKDILYAYKNVSVYKSDFQGIADSIVYSSKDSLMYFYQDPVLWTEGSQLTSDTMRMVMKNGVMDELVMSSNSFIISKDKLNQYNQIKGRVMVTKFKDEEISRVNVSGNGESIYFVIDEEKGKLTGMNKVICSNMLIRFLNNNVNRITFYVNPDGDFYPPHEIKEENAYLNGFSWREQEKPSREYVLRLEELKVLETPTKTKKIQE